MPYMNYCSSSWYSSLSAKLQGKIDVLQRRMVRYIFSLLPRGPMWERESCVSFAGCRFLIWSSFPSFNIYLKFDLDWPLSTFLRGFILLLEPTHTLSVEVDIITEFQRNWQTTFAFTAITDWNSLPFPLKECKCFPAFRSKLKGHFLSLY